MTKIAICFILHTKISLAFLTSLWRDFVTFGCRRRVKIVCMLLRSVLTFGWEWVCCCSCPFFSGLRQSLWKMFCFSDWVRLIVLVLRGCCSSVMGMCLLLLVKVADVDWERFHGEVRVASRGQEIVSVASQGDRFKFISCVPRLKRNCINCVPDCQPQHAQLRPAVSKELYHLHRKMWVYKMSNNWKVLTVLLYFTLCTIVWTHTELLNDIDNTVFISCYCPMFKPY
jgi:hypothetical protein